MTSADRSRARAKQQHWTRRLQRQSRSGLTVAEFCKAEGISAATFYYWNRRLTQKPSGNGRPPKRRRRKADATAQLPVSPTAFKPVWVAQPATPAATIHLPQGIVIELGHDPQTIKEVIAELRGHAVTAAAPAGGASPRLSQGDDPCSA